MRKGLGYRLWMGAVNQLTKKFSVNQLDKYLCCCKEATPDASCLSVTEDCAIDVLKVTTDRHEASRGLCATAGLGYLSK